MMVMVLFKFCCCIFTIFSHLTDGVESQRGLSHDPSANFNDNETISRALIANFESNGINGSVIFAQNETDTVITVHLSGGVNHESFNWKIYSMPTNLVDGSCASATIGSPIHGMDLTTIFGPLQVGSESTFVAPNVRLVNGKNSILGRTLFLRGIISGQITCATLMPIGPKILFQSKFHSPVHGTVTVMQSENMTIIATELAFSNGTKKITENKWGLIVGQNEDVSYDSQFRHEITKCSMFKRSSLFYNTTDTELINIGLDLTGTTGKSFITLKDLIKLERLPIVYLIIFSENNLREVISCAPLHQIKSKTAAAKFNNPEIRGSITLTQESPFDPTVVDINIDIFEHAYSYGIDDLPKIVRSKDETSKACPNIRSIIYNPQNIEPDSVPREGHGTSDQYAIGDLSGKYGTLYNKKSETIRILDYNLPLFGRFSVVGRALVIYAADGPAIACANIELSGANMTTAFSTFDTPIQGQFIFRQQSGNCADDTSVYLEISKPGDENISKTMHHLWHIHQNPIDSDATHWSSSNCSVSGSHFNPYKVATDCIYFKDCSQTNPLRCELGDVSSKLGTIDIPPYMVNDDGELDIGKYFFTDVFLPLCGPTSIINKSLGIRGENFDNHRVACANIIEYKPRVRSRS